MAGSVGSEARPPTRRAFLRATLGTGAAALLPACAGPGRRARTTVRVVATFGGRGTAEGRFLGPIAIATTASDELLVTDLHNARVQRLSSEGRFLGAFELPRDMTTAHGRSASAGGIAVDAEGLVHVTAMMSHRVLVFGPSGERVRAWGELGSGPGELHEPGGIAVGDDGAVYVADQRNRRVQVFTRDGRFVRSWGGYGRGPGRFDGIEAPSSRFGGPNDVALDGRGRVYTTEGAPGRVQAWTVEGDHLGAFGTKDESPGGFGALLTPFSPHTFGPIGVATDRAGLVWVSSLNGRVQLFDPDGTYRGGIGRPGSGPGELRNPHGLAVDRRNDVYVVDSGNHRVVKLAVS